jgi:hypothetical protein
MHVGFSQIRRAYDSFTDWLSIFISALELGQSSVKIHALQLTKIEPLQYDPRADKLAEGAILKLPVPVQTLVVALNQLKLDIAQDTIRQRLNYESICYNKLESAAACASKTLALLTSETESILKEGLENYTNDDLEQDILKVLQPDLKQSFNKPLVVWNKTILEAIRKTQEALHAKTVLNTTVSPVESRHMESKGTKSAIEAVEASKHVRQRLQNLAEGPLASFFEIKGQSQEITQQETSIAEVTSHVQNDTILEEQLDTLKRLARRTRKSLDLLYEEKESIMCLALTSTIQALKSLRSSLLVPTEEPILVEGSMKHADESIQAEIKLLLGTLVIDHGALDQVLRMIKQKCMGSIEASNAEAFTKWHVGLTRWLLQLRDAWDSWTLVYKNAMSY